MRRLVIAVDCDDVLVPTTNFFVEEYNKKYGTNVMLADAHTESDEIWGASHAVMLERFAETMQTEAYQNLGPTKDEAEVLTELSKHHELHVVTARKEDERALTQAMIDRYLPSVFTSLELVGWQGSKGDVCQRIAADVLIDDSARHLHNAIEKGLPVQGALLFGNYEWNKDDSAHDDLTHCHDWFAVKDAVDRVAEVSMRKTIAVDVDDVLSAHAQAFVDFSNERWGTRLTVDDYDDDWAKVWGLGHTYDKDASMISLRANDFLSHAVPVMGHDATAKDVLIELKKAYTLIVVTSRKLETKGDTLAWIQERFEGIFSDDTIHFAGFYDTLTSESVKRNKGELLKSLGADYLIDDQPKHCNGAMEQGIQGVLFGEYAWHQKEAINSNVVRVKNWQEVLEYFNAEQQRISN